MNHEPLLGAEPMPGDPGHVYGLPTDEALSNHRLDTAATEVVGQMHDFQGIAPTSHNSGDLTAISPVTHGSMPGDHHVKEAFGGGFGKAC